MPRRAPFLVLLVLCPLTLHAQFPIAAPEKRPAFGYQRAPSVAANGRDFLAAWEDVRAAHFQPFGRDSQTEFDIFGTRIGLDGVGLSDGGVPISPSGAFEGSPVVLWNGSEYVVIHDVNGRALVFTRVLADRLAERKEVAASPASQTKAAWNGTRYLVVRGQPWYLEGGSLKAFVASPDFEVAVPEFMVSEGFLPSVGSNGSDFLAAWLVDRGNYIVEIRTAVISNEGVVRTIETIAAFTRNETLPLTAPAIVWNGSGYLVVWSDAASISGRHVDRDGNAAPETFTIARSQGVEVTAPDAAWNGSIYLVTFSYRNEWLTPTVSPTTNLYAARMSSDGTLIDSPYPLTISTTPGPDDSSSVAASGSTFIVAWHHDADVVSATIDGATGAVGPPQVLARSVWEQSSPEGVFDGSNLAFTWQEWSGSPGDKPLVLFGRVTPNGHHVDGSGIEIGSGLPGPIAFAGVYLVTWRRNGTSPRGIRIAPDGRILDQEPIVLSTSIGELGTDGQSFLHVGTTGAGTLFGDPTVLRVETIGSSGPPSPAKEIVPESPFDQIPVSLAWNGSRYLLLYRQYLGRLDCGFRCFPSQELRMVMLDRNGERISDSVLLQLDTTGLVAGGGGDRFLVAIVSNIESENRYIIFGNDGAELGSGRLGFQPVDVAWDGTSFTITGFRYSSHLLRVDRNGNPLSERTLIGVQQPRSLRLIPAGGAVALIEARVEKTTYAHDAGILRYQFSWLEQRRRAVAR